MTGTHSLVPLHSIEVTSEVGTASRERVNRSIEVALDDHGPSHRETCWHFGWEADCAGNLPGLNAPEHGHESAKKGKPHGCSQDFPEHLSARDGVPKMHAHGS
jgi:hypothetical protein